MLIDYQNIAADSVSFQTTNGILSGAFSVTKLLNLQTKNGLIDIHAIAKNDPKHDEETQVMLSSSNRLAPSVWYHLQYRLTQTS